MKTLAEANISPGLSKLQFIVRPPSPRQAQQSMQQLIGVSISHQQIRQLCVQEAVKVKVQEQTDFQQADKALAETVEVTNQGAAAVKEAAAD